MQILIRMNKEANQRTTPSRGGMMFAPYKGAMLPAMPEGISMASQAIGTFYPQRVV